MDQLQVPPEPESAAVWSEPDAGRLVFVTGGTGFMGRSLVPELLRRGHRVRGLVREGSQWKLPAACEVVVGDRSPHPAAAPSGGSSSHSVA